MTDLISKDKVLRCLKESSEQIDWGQSEDGDAFKHYVGASYRTIAEFKPEQPQWISVKDRMPDAAGYECLVCAVNDQTHVFTAHTGYGEPGWWTSNVHYMSRITSPSDNKLHPALNVTHWMPLPTPPEVNRDED